MVEVEVSVFAGIALKVNGTVFIWGNSGRGLGNGVTSKIGRASCRERV